MPLVFCAKLTVAILFVHDTGIVKVKLFNFF
jgi:hypothetical protein